jgi:topoisomerase-4 subunit A
MATAKPIEQDIRDEPLATALSERYLAYALSTIMSRSLPDVRDGLKPVHRRLLYAMRQLHLDPEKGFKKCARVVGDVIGKYHPHGDVAVYDALVRLAQDFAVRYPLVDGQGNFGNIDGDNAAAMRYTEARLTGVAQEMMAGLDEDAVDFRDTYDGEESEPIVLPAGFPNLLANGSTGIAVGMATNIPPHNADEICAALLHLIKFPNATIDKLTELIPGPDFPTGGLLVESHESVLGAYRTGRGSFRLRARWVVEKLSHGQCEVVITEIPYQVQKARLIERIADLLLARKLPFLADVRDESSDDLRIVLEPRNRTVKPEMVMEQLFRQTDLEVRISLNMNVLDGGVVPRVMGLRDVLAAFLTHRHDVLRRRTSHRLDKIARRLDVLGGLLIAYLNLDEVIRIIREEDEAKQSLIAAFGLTDTQAEAILNMRLRQLRKLEEIEIRQEHEDLIAEQKDLNALLGDEPRCWKVIAGEIAETREAFGKNTDLGRRRTEISGPPSTVIIPLDVMIERESVTVICSDKGWIRATKGHAIDTTGIKYKDGDREGFVLPAQTTDKLVIFATNGRFYTLGCEKLPGGRGNGEPLRLMIELENGVDVVSMHIHKPGHKFLMSSDAGRGFVVQSDDVVGQTRNGKQVLNLGGGEEAAVCWAMVEGDDFVAVLGINKRLLIFPLDEIPTMNRGRGVILQRFKDGGLLDAKTFRLKDGLTWRTGSRTRTELDLLAWLGKRGQAGRLPPRGLSSRFT